MGAAQDDKLSRTLWFISECPAKEACRHSKESWQKARVWSWQGPAQTISYLLHHLINSGLHSATLEGARALAHQVTMKRCEETFEERQAMRDEDDRVAAKQACPKSRAKAEDGKGKTKGKGKQSDDAQSSERGKGKQSDDANEEEKDPEKGWRELERGDRWQDDYKRDDTDDSWKWQSGDWNSDGGWKLEAWRRERSRSRDKPASERSASSSTALVPSTTAIVAVQDPDAVGWAANAAKGIMKGMMSAALVSPLVRSSQMISVPTQQLKLLDDALQRIQLSTKASKAFCDQLSSTFHNESDIINECRTIMRNLIRESGGTM
jgi:hypothetical protein